MASVELRQVSKSFGNSPIIHRIDLSVPSGQFLVLVGPSGCGKSTLLRMVAGLEDVSGGDIAIGGRVVNELTPKERGVAMVFQNYALYPHMTVEQNLSFGLKLAKCSSADITARVTDAARILGLSDQLKKKPGQLSGGQKQRVAMGRAMVRQPAVFLFDEPLSNLDAQLRVRMRAEISLLHRRTKATIVYVTHDQIEAMTLADQIAVMRAGFLEQVGRPLDVYNDPATQFVASFIGTPPMNFLPATMFPAGAVPKGDVTVGFRPEGTIMGTTGQIALGRAKVRLVEPLGTIAYVHLDVAGQPVIAESKALVAPALDLELPLSVEPTALFFFDAAGKRVRSQP